MCVRCVFLAGSREIEREQQQQQLQPDEVLSVGGKMPLLVVVEAALAAAASDMSLVGDLGNKSNDEKNAKNRYWQKVGLEQQP